MSDKPNGPGFSLRRWSQRKLEASRRTNEHDEARNEERAPDSAHATGEPSTVPSPSPHARIPSASTTPVAQPSSNAVPSAVGSPVETVGERLRDVSLPELPPIDSLTIDSDFSPFMSTGVDESVRRSALKKLFRDPRFNVMDGLDVYIDDYSKPDPIAPEIVRTLVQARYIFNPPATRVNEQGYVEDVPEDDLPKAGEQEAETATDTGPETERASDSPVLQSTSASGGVSDVQRSTNSPMSAVDGERVPETPDHTRVPDVLSNHAPSDAQAAERS